MIEWNIVPIVRTIWFSPLEYLAPVKEVKVNDNNEEYCWNDGTWTSKNTEIYVEKGKPTLVITVGESWTHGEGADEINHRFEKWNVIDRVEIPYGSKIARALDADYWTFSRPGNSNSGIFTGLLRILDNIPSGKYSDIKVCVQMTDSSRDRLVLLPHDHFLQKHSKPNSKQNIHVKEWFAKYDEGFFELLHNKIAERSDLPLDVVVFKNFNKICTDKRDYNFKILDMYWLKYNATYYGMDFEDCYSLHPAQYEDLIKHNILQDIDRDFVNADLDRWEKLLQFLHHNCETNQSDHPTKLSQSLWAMYLLQVTKWLEQKYENKLEN